MSSPYYGLEILTKSNNTENIIKFIQLFHDDYCRQMFQLIEQLRFKNTNQEDYKNLIDWAIEYRNQIQPTTMVLEDLTNQLKENKTEMSPIYIKGREIQEQLKKAFKDPRSLSSS